MTSSNESVCFYFHPMNILGLIVLRLIKVTICNHALDGLRKSGREDEQKTVRMKVLNLCTKTGLAGHL